MRRLLIVLLLIGMIFGPRIDLSARTSITLVATFWVSSGGNSGGVDTTGATLLVMGADCDGTPNPTDSKASTWSSLAAQVTSGGNRFRLSYAANPIVGTSHTFTAGGSCSFSGIVVLAFSGIKTTSPLDQSSQNAATTTALQAGSITPTENDELVIMGAGDDSSYSTINSGYTIGKAVNTGGCCYAAGLAYKIISGAPSAQNPTWTVTSHPWATSIASFKNASPVSANSFPGLFFSGTF